jgi:hypothetical protein
MDLCTGEREEDEYGVGDGVNTTPLSDTLLSIVGQKVSQNLLRDLLTIVYLILVFIMNR